VIIALSVACGYEYDFEYDFEYMTLNMTGQGRPPPRKKKRRGHSQAQVVDPKGQVITGNPKFDDGNDNDFQDDEKGDFFVINDDHYRPSFIQVTYGNVPEGGL
jgi:hypothetical protein